MNLKLNYCNFSYSLTPTPSSHLLANQLSPQTVFSTSSIKIYIFIRSLVLPPHYPPEILTFRLRWTDNKHCMNNINTAAVAENAKETPSSHHDDFQESLNIEVATRKEQKETESKVSTATDLFLFIGHPYWLMPACLTVCLSLSKVLPTADYAAPPPHLPSTPADRPNCFLILLTATIFSPSPLHLPLLVRLLHNRQLGVWRSGRQSSVRRFLGAVQHQWPFLDHALARLSRVETSLQKDRSTTTQPVLPLNKPPTHLQCPVALRIFAPRVRRHEWPLGEPIPVVVIVLPATQNHRPGNAN